MRGIVWVARPRLYRWGKVKACQIKAQPPPSTPSSRRSPRRWPRCPTTPSLRSPTWTFPSSCGAMTASRSTPTCARRASWWPSCRPRARPRPPCAGRWSAWARRCRASCSAPTTPPSRSPPTRAARPRTASRPRAPGGGPDHGRRRDAGQGPRRRDRPDLGRAPPHRARTRASSPASSSAWPSPPPSASRPRRSRPRLGRRTTPRRPPPSRARCGAEDEDAGRHRRPRPTRRPVRARLGRGRGVARREPELADPPELATGDAHRGQRPPQPSRGRARRRTRRRFVSAQVRA